MQGIHPIREQTLSAPAEQDDVLPLREVRDTGVDDVQIQLELGLVPDTGILGQTAQRQQLVLIQTVAGKLCFETGAIQEFEAEPQRDRSRDFASPAADLS